MFRARSRCRTFGLLIAFGFLTLGSDGPAAQAQPANDDCQTAAPILGGFISFNNTDASVGAADGCFPAGPDIWYAATCTRAGTWRCDTAGNLNMRWAFYTGPDCNNLTLLGCRNFGQTLSTPLSVGQRIYIRYTTTTATSNGLAQIFFPGDRCILATPATEGFTQYNALSDLLPDNIGLCSLPADTWYIYTAPLTDTATLQRGQRIGGIAVYASTNCSALGTPLICETEPALTTYTFPVQAGAQYLLRLQLTSRGITSFFVATGPMGACCTNSVCSVTTPLLCTGGGGSHLGAGTTCAPDPCVPPAVTFSAPLPCTTRTVYSIGPFDTTYEGYDITVDSCVSLVIDGAHSFHRLTIRSGGEVTHTPGFPGGMNLSLATSLDIEPNAGPLLTGINASGKGYAAGSGPAPGICFSPAAAPGGGGGGAHGGDGGWVPGSPSLALGYGEFFQPVSLGSGGGDGASTNGGPCIPLSGGPGGGAIQVHALGSIHIDGVLSAEGLAGLAPSGAGGGAGGSIWLVAPTITGFGVISTTGGDGASAGPNSPAGGGGGGGRIMLQHGGLFAGSVLACPGVGNLRAGAGTIATQPPAPTTTLPSLLIAACQRPLPEVAPNHPPPQPGVGPDVPLAATRAPAAPQPQPPAVDGLDVADASCLDLHADEQFKNLVIRTGSKAVTTSFSKIKITGNLTVDATSSLLARCTGGLPAAHMGNAPSSANVAGGGGGNGGDGGTGGDGTLEARNATPGGPAFGLVQVLSVTGQAGKAGGNGQGAADTGGRGGGQFDLDVAGIVTLDGTIDVSGCNGTLGAGAQFGGGGGAGGTVRLKAQTFNGTGIINARGGNGWGGEPVGNRGGGGAGGRITTVCAQGMFMGIHELQGGTGWDFGAPGILFTDKNGVRTLTITDEEPLNAATPLNPSRFIMEAAPPALVVSGVRVAFANGLEFKSLAATDSRLISRANGKVVLKVEGNAALVRSKTEVKIEMPGVNPPRAGAPAPAAGPNGAGAGNAGAGGAAAGGNPGGVIPNPAIRNAPKVPADGAGPPAVAPVPGQIPPRDPDAGGAAGGHAVIIVDGQLSIDADSSISADGDPGSANAFGAGGGGAGGSLEIFAGTLSGNGFITARGGAGADFIGSPAGGGGGGGVIILHSCNNLFGPSHLLVDGGPGFQSGEPGFIGHESNSVVISVQPASLTLNAGQTAAFSVAASGAGPLSFDWRFNGTPAPLTPRHSGHTTPTFTISPAAAIDSGIYEVYISDNCGSFRSAQAVLTIAGPRSDFNGSGTVTVQDIFDFLAAYFAQDPLADFNGSGTVTVQDIFDFLAAYFTGS